MYGNLWQMHILVVPEKMDFTLLSKVFKFLNGYGYRKESILKSWKLSKLKLSNVAFNERLTKL